MNLKKNISLLVIVTLVFVSCSTNEINSNNKKTKDSEDVKKSFSLDKNLDMEPVLGLLDNIDTENSYLNDKNFKGNKIVASFSSAKNLLKKMHFFGIKEELYCGCEFKGINIAKNAKCGIKPRNSTNSARTFKIEFEHIIPFENQTGHTKAYKVGLDICKGKSKRACASKAFPHLEADLWNLWPASGEMNGDRSNHPYSVLSGPILEINMANVISDMKMIV